MDRSLLALCVLLGTGLALALDCDWDQSIDPEQGLAGINASMMISLDKISEVSDPESCRAKCCTRPDCDLVLVRLPADGLPQCLLVSCLHGDQDVCVLGPAARSKVYRKKGPREAGRQRQEGGDELRLVPLMGSWEPRTNMTHNQLSQDVESAATDLAPAQEKEMSAADFAEHCGAEPQVGPCRAAFQHWYYNSKTGGCQSFIYGGCRGNKNNYISKESCMATCTELSQDVESAATDLAPAQEKEMSAADFAEHCGAEPQVGPCRAAFQHWYYNSKTGGCQSFIYGGCRGNKNNYISKESCMATCTVRVLSSSKKIAADDEVSTEYKDGCLATSDPGPCRAAFPRFYYDPNTATCQSFIYGGCHGNQNRYSTVDECMSRCRRSVRDRWTAAVFLFVTLAVISALLLVTLVIITLRRHRRSHRSSSISDKEELLPDPDEQSSLESLAIPESPKSDKA